jgi:hypothetical protein
MPDYVPPSPPTQHGARPEEAHTDAQRAMYDALLARFGAPDYAIPSGAGVKEGEGALSDKEKLWLVSLRMVSALEVC